MTNKQIAEIAELSKQSVLDVVKAQVTAGDKKGVTGARQQEIIVKALDEILDSTPMPRDYGDEGKWRRNVMRAFFGATATLNASQLRQNLEKAGVLEKTGVAGGYGIES